MKRILFPILIFLGAQCSILAQFPSPEAPFQDSNYLESIASVQFYLSNFPLRVPVINKNDSVTLHFDNLNDEVYDFSFSLIHCNGDWSRSQLSQSEYARGFDEEKIDNYTYSFQTTTNYVHYWLKLPNSDMQWLVSGNYVLVVYLDESPRQVAFTRRFVVVEDQVKINAEFIRPLDISKSDSHHELNFTIAHDDFPIADPQNEVKTTVIKNWRWDKAKMLKAPRYTRARSLVYNQNGQFLFAAGNEHRPLDIRSVEYRAANIYSITHNRDHIEITVETDVIRAHKNYLDYADINGQFIVLNNDYQGINISNDTSNIYRNSGKSYHHIQSEYAWIEFTLEAPQTSRNPIFLTGGFANWKALPQYRMKFYPDEQIYYTDAYLKQGYYDYYYVEKLPDGSLRGRDTEGNYFETENEYLILVYYRPFGGRYDRVIASTSLFSG